MESKKDSWLTPVPKQSLSKMVVEKIKEGLISGAIVPGEFLPSETELSERFGVGKSSVREAVKMLEAMGVVEICKGNGSRIRTTVDSSVMNPLIFQLILQSRTESKDKLVEFRRMLEVSGSLLAIDNASDEDIKELKDIHERTKQDFKKGRATVENDMEFHNKIYESTHNPFVVSIGRSIMELFQPSLVIANRDYSRMVTDNHDKILKALEGRNKAAMEEAIILSLEKWKELALDECME
ncbi:MAG: FadR family transcriptional regulator [Faecalicatena sp.]|uniref:FadR/GntR family transcriptional regulator n=1 Tax=Faecalicatena sp. TaxID=2005360 RepID=UPI00258E0CB9|nr:FadR/GntR family transcriptional regulator [Faecalicatena sp.]MCI6464681.1 FadR family transcriptional regulator [Faecalicatena sp.]MDY5618259.1 FadR/GntR family transcriptional regulator [Lachnospiraceae bacterium]